MTSDILAGFNIEEWATKNGYAVAGRATLPPRPEKRVKLPPGYEDPLYTNILKAIGIEDGRVWNQQAEALEALTAGFGNAIAATPTASGKSLIFQLAAIRKILNHPNDRVLVFYPTRALNSDQCESWQKIMAAANFMPKHLSIIDGSVPMEERVDILRDARIALMTPDTVHAWMMANLNIPVVRNFLSGLSLKILDEAHLYDGVFGSYMSLLLKRIQFAQRTLNPGFRDDYHNQVIMATATLPDPQAFARKLVGEDAWVIGPEYDTSPQYQRDIVLLRTRDMRRRGAVRSLLNELAPMTESGGILTFVDSRTGADELAEDANYHLSQIKSQFRFAAHRSGQTAEYRSEIEKQFKSNALKGIVATPTLDVGVDFPNIRTVIMESLPDDPGRFRQRFGRLRKGGLCITVDDESRLLRLGPDGLNAYLRESSRQPLLYTANAKIAAEQALCFVDELEKLGTDDFEDTAILCKMPRMFLNAVADYQDKLTEDLSFIQYDALPPEGRGPHLFHSIRSIDGPIRRMRIYNPGKNKSITVGEVTQGQALREALPGMIVYANGRKYRVRSWAKSGGLKAAINLTAIARDDKPGFQRTRALVRTSTRTYLNSMRIIGKSLRTDHGGENLMLYAQFDVQQRAVGFAESTPTMTTHYLFDDRIKETEVVKTRKNQTIIRTPAYGPPRENNSQTQGAAFRITKNYMSDRALQILGRVMHKAFCEEFSISPNDVGVMINRTKLGYGPGRMEEGRCILLYDKHPGGMGFSHRAYKQFDRLAGAMLSQVDGKDPLLEGIIESFLQWHSTLKLRVTPTYEQWLRFGQPKLKKASGQIIFFNNSTFSRFFIRFSP